MASIRSLAVLFMMFGIAVINLAGQQSVFPDNTALQGMSLEPGGLVPRLIKFTGALHEANGSVPRGAVSLTFSLYGLSRGGSPLWSETQSTELDAQGNYVVLLGATLPTGLPLELFSSGQALWLGVQPQLPGVGELPRVLLVAVPYALKASDSDTLGGKPASAYALAGSQALVVPAGGASTSSASTTTAQPSSQEVSAAGSASSPETSCAAVTSDGTATANTVAKFTSACNVENSLIRDNGTGVAVGGTSAPGALLDVQYTSTGTSGSLLGQRVLSTFNPAATSSASNIGAISDAQTATGNTQNFTGYLTAMNFSVNHYGKGTLAAEYGMIGYAVNSAAGTISKAVGAYTSLENVSTGTITNGYGVYVNSPVNSGGGKFSNYTGLYIANPSAVTGAYGLYSAGGTNYFGGNVGIGTTTPAANLEVDGTAQFDSLVTFESGQTFPGTLAGITPGTGILSTGGANPTLSLNTGVTNGLYAALTGGNTITGTQQINPGSINVQSNSNTTAITAYGSNGGIGGNFNGGSNTATTGGSGGYGLTVQGGNSSVSSGAGGYGLYVTGGASSGANGESANGILAYGGTSSNTDITPGSGVVGIGGTSLDPTQTGGFGVWASGGTDNSGGVGGIGLYAGGGAGTTAAQQGYAALFDGIVEVGSLFNTQINTNTLLLGSPTGCSSGFVGIGIGFGSFADCAHYALLGEGTNTIINRPSGGAIYFREANGYAPSEMTIAAGGAVTITGDLTVNGTLAKHAGSFKIDHPLDPANKYLYHSFVESPDMMNIYNGNAVLNKKGEAVIELPKWFQALNKDFRYQLTCIGGYAPVYIAEEINNNHFKIAGGKPGVKVSWQVTGVRQDAYANAHRIPVEEEKSEAERGHYTYPELYGQPPEKAIDVQLNAHSDKEIARTAAAHSGEE